MIITIDGPAGTGKSTVAKMLASKIGFVFFDTGAMYRAVTFQLLKDAIDFCDKSKISQMLQGFNFRIETHLGEKHYYIGSQEVTEDIRSQLVTKNVSEVSALAAVREAMVLLQRRFSEGINAVYEGRDLGSVVFPKADLKIFLTASPEIRAERRFREFVFKHPAEAENMTKQQVFEDLLRRDSFDSSREISPLKPADDAIILDTSDLTIDEVVDEIFTLFQEILRK